ncbi:DUF2332 domain-containing protein [Rhodovulum visakhapatnamense]|uniref:DUF2332 family protein n=1 Tax=Rhodovulum visakhapatnamense TaxID=364297 RepID=A0A4R8FSM5_9RHOB|nr:DUF2332 family protein [Rhodovulum visakhapatnamense]TDX29635.1 hypothetical protein EV657_10854 [Rhodovulum visakhapatnamense]
MDLRAACTDQAAACARLGSPFTAGLLRLAAERLRPGGAVADRLLGWKGALGAGGQSVPLRLAGALHGLVLSGAASGLAALYPPEDPDPDGLWAEIEAAFTTHEAQLMRWLDSPPQTNEVRRSAVLIAAGHWLTAATGLPLVLSEIGASAGLNLNWDRYALDLPEGSYGPADARLRLAPDWQGPVPPQATPRVIDRRGVDLNPIEGSTPEGALRLRAYLWPDQPDRRRLTDAALAEPPAPVDREDALPWLARRLADPSPGALHMIFHTVAWQYLPEEAHAEGDRLIAEAGARATETAPLARVEMEADGGDGAALRITLWPGGPPRAVGRADFHGRWVRWTAAETPDDREGRI